MPPVDGLILPCLHRRRKPGRPSHPSHARLFRETLDEMGVWQSPEPVRAQDLLEVELRKWDQDFRFLLDCFQRVLTRIREPELARLAGAAFAAPPEQGERFLSAGRRLSPWPFSS